MIDPPLPLVINKPLVFGDKDVIERIKFHEKQTEKAKTMCGECLGEGEIICPCCKGTGEDLQ